MKLAFVLFEYFPFGGLQRDMLAIAQASVAPVSYTHLTLPTILLV